MTAEIKKLNPILLLLLLLLSSLHPFITPFLTYFLCVSYFFILFSKIKKYVFQFLFLMLLLLLLLCCWFPLSSQHWMITIIQISFNNTNDES